MNILIEKLDPARISESDPNDISLLMEELSGRQFKFTQKEMGEIAKSTTTIVARLPDDRNRIVGLGCVVSMRLPQGVRHLIESVVVLSSFRGMGIGRRVINALIEEANIIGKGSINLTCNPKRIEALALYQKIGFSKADTSVYRLNTATL